MAISRRSFLTAGTFALAYASMPLKALANHMLSARGGGSGRSTGDSKSAIHSTLHLNRESFSHCVNTTFSFADSYSSNKVKLIKVRDLSRGLARPDKGMECFSLLFRGSPAVAMPQNTYRITHETLGTFAALIVLVGSDSHGTYYEAVFNRLH